MEINGFEILIIILFIFFLFNNTKNNSKTYEKYDTASDSSQELTQAPELNSKILDNPINDTYVNIGNLSLLPYYYGKASNINEAINIARIYGAKFFQLKNKKLYLGYDIPIVSSSNIKNTSTYSIFKFNQHNSDSYFYNL
jgi:hypothetical protein